MATESERTTASGHEELTQEQTMLESGQQELDAEAAEQLPAAGMSSAPVLDQKDPVQQTYDEEFAAEAAPIAPAAQRTLIQPEDDRPSVREFRAVETEEAGKSTGYVGWVAIVLAVASLFVWPAVLGPAAILLGFISWVQGSRALGIWSVVLGVISFIAYIALVPLYS